MTVNQSSAISMAHRDIHIPLALGARIFFRTDCRSATTAMRQNGVICRLLMSGYRI
jgi:hypothetical protein